MKRSMIFLMCFGLSLWISGQARAAEVPGITKDTILLGALAPLTGFLTVTGAAAHDGWQMYFDMVNEAGGVHGRKIKAIWEDDACTPAKGMAAAKKLIVSDKVFALVGGVCSGAIAPVVPTIMEQKIPFFTANCSDPGLTQPTKRYVFEVSQIPTNYEARALSKLAVEYFKVKKLAILHGTDEYSTRHSEYGIKYLDEKNIKPVSVETFNPGDVDFSSQLAKLKEAKADAVILVAYVQDGPKVVVQARRMEFNPLWIGAGPLAEEPFAVEAGEAAVGAVCYYSGKYLTTDTHVPMIAKFREEFKKRIGEKPGRPSLIDIGNYTGAMVFVEGLKRAGKDLTREKLIDALESIKNFDTYLADPVSFSKNDHQGNYRANFIVCLPNLNRAILNVNIMPK